MPEANHPPVTAAPEDLGRLRRTGRQLLEPVEALERRSDLDPTIDAIAGRAPATLVSGPARKLLGGAWLGHSVHPPLTDLPLGLWTSASLLDLLGGRTARGCATGLVAAGVVTALPTALTGFSDWLVADRESQRVGAVHAAANASALGLYTASCAARLTGHHAAGVLLGWAGGSAALVGGFLGGHLMSMRGTSMRASRQALKLRRSVVPAQDDDVTSEHLDRTLATTAN